MTKGWSVLAFSSMVANSSIWGDPDIQLCTLLPQVSPPAGSPGSLLDLVSRYFDREDTECDYRNTYPKVFLRPAHLSRDLTEKLRDYIIGRAATFAMPMATAPSSSSSSSGVRWHSILPGVDRTKVNLTTPIAGNYEARAQKTECGETDKMPGLWGMDVRDELKCVYSNIGPLLGMRPASTVLDWGSGCGAPLAFMRQEFAIRGLGIDATPTAVAYAQERFGTPPHTQNTHNVEHTSSPEVDLQDGISYRYQDGSDLSNFEDNTFDFVTSYGAIVYLKAQCDILMQMLRVVRKRVWLGWLTRDWRGPIACRTFRRCVDIINERSEIVGIKARVDVCAPDLCIFGASAMGFPTNTLIVTKDHLGDGKLGN